MYKNEEVEKLCNRLLESNKPKIIVGSLKNTNELTEQQIKHFKTAEYLWQLKPIDDGGRYNNMHMGLLLDENLTYVHIVFATKSVLDFLLNNKTD